MKTIKIGIQGDIGSTNERACKEFIKRYKWNPESISIEYLITSENVVQALIQNTIHYGIFATYSSRQGEVKETKKALSTLSSHEKTLFRKHDEITLQLDHALLTHPNHTLNTKLPIHIYSHPQALSEHKKYIMKRFTDYKDIICIPEIDTAKAAENLANNLYSKNSVVIAPIICKTLYNLSVLENTLPTNEGYETTFYLLEATPQK